jgi:hypothetical protein
VYIIHIYQHKVSTNLLVINNHLEMVIKGQNIALELMISLNCKGCIRASCSILATDSCDLCEKSQSTLKVESRGVFSGYSGSLSQGMLTGWVGIIPLTDPPP